MDFIISVPDAAVPRIEAAYRSRMANGGSATKAEVAAAVREDLYDVLRTIVLNYEDAQASTVRRNDRNDPLNSR